MEIKILVFGVLIFLSCSTRPEAQSVKQSDTLVNNTHDEQIEINAIDSILYKSESFHYFSSTSDKDLFKIIVFGKSIKDGQFKFQIKTKDGRLILNENYDTRMLLDYGFKGNPTNKEIEDYIKTRIDKFFIEKNFYQPAIPETEAFEKDYSKKEIWEDIIADQTSIGFYYLIGEEDGRKIAFSKKLERVVIYYNCC